MIDEYGNVAYQASSPDEVAIVKWTQVVGVTLIKRDLNSITLRVADNVEMKFEILEIFPFTSESKRMGIIIRDLSSAEIVFYQKGADSIMTRLIQANDWIDEECGNMAREGLRTLVVARKRMSQESFEVFHKELLEAKSSMTERQQQVQQVVALHLERELELLGLTGVEDKLQV